MFIILGASGNIGSVVVDLLRRQGHPVLAVVNHEAKAQALQSAGIEAAAVDVGDSQALRGLLRRGTRAFLLNPPGDVTGDSNADELRTGHSIAAALSDCGLEKVVVASTYGAQAGDGIGDLSTLHAFEQAVLRIGIPAAINRGAYYFSNLNALIEPAEAGVLTTPLPASFTLPMVSAIDLAEAAVERLLSPATDIGVVNVEGPQRYTFADVAAAFSRQLGRRVIVETTPRDQLEDSFKAAGFSAVAAETFARMTRVTMDQPDWPQTYRRGRISLEDYVASILT